MAWNVVIAGGGFGGATVARRLERMLPKQSARLEHPDLLARNILVRGVGHMSLPIDRRIVRGVGDLGQERQLVRETDAHGAR